MCTKLLLSKQKIRCLAQERHFEAGSWMELPAQSMALNRFCQAKTKGESLQITGNFIRFEVPSTKILGEKDSGEVGSQWRFPQFRIHRI
jgi:hypothetical protein